MIIDLTHTLRPGLPNWLPKNSFDLEKVSDYDSVARQHEYRMAGKAGTHIDSPSHFIPGGHDTASFKLEHLIAPLVVLHQPLPADGFATADHLRAIEAEHGPIPSGSIFFLNSGWWKRWPDVDAYRNPDAEGIPLNPGVTLEAAQLLAERGVVGLGVDSINIDGSNRESPVHKFWLGQERYAIENLAHLDDVPPTGATGIVLPLKIAGGSEAPIRAVALI